VIVSVDTALAFKTRRAMTGPVSANAVPPAEAFVAELLRSPELQQDGGAPPRVLLPLSVARYNAGMVHGYSTPASYVGVAPDRVWTFIHETAGASPPLHNTGPSRAIFRRPFPYDSMSLVIGFDAAEQRLVRNVPPDPRAYVAPCAERVASWKEAVRRVASGHDVHHCALVEAEAQIPERLGAGNARILSFAAEEVTVRVESTGPALVVLGEAWFPGWEAHVDGHPAPCFPVNAWMRGAAVPAGRHDVVFSYRSWLLGPGALVSGMSGLLALFCVRRGRYSGVMPTQ
jgi:hypothetical protein